MTVAYPRWLYVRIDHELRRALVRAAAAEGRSVSDLARDRLRRSLGLSSEPPQPKRGPAADLAEALHRAGEPSRRIGEILDRVAAPARDISECLDRIADQVGPSRSARDRQT